MNGYKVAYYNLYRLFEEISLARISSTLHRFFAKLAQTDLLILDDFGMKVLDGQQLLDFMEIIEDRHGQKALYGDYRRPTWTESYYHHITTAGC